MLTDYQKRFVKIINSFRYGSGVRNVFEDFVRLGTYEISQNTRRSIGWEIDDDDEQAYLEIVKKYKPDEVRGPFKEMFDCLVEGLGVMEGDFLGPIYMDLKLGNKALGQFFTPYHVSLMMAEMQIDRDEIRRKIDEKGYVAINDPCCGSGGMPIAYAQAFRKAEFNQETELFVIAQDLDSTMACMCYLQLSLRGIPALVLNMNSMIPDKVFWRRYTPMYFWMGWPMRMQKENTPVRDSQPIDCESNEIIVETRSKRSRKPKVLPAPTIQKTLFGDLS